MIPPPPKNSKRSRWASYFGRIWPCSCPLIYQIPDHQSIMQVTRERDCHIPKRSHYPFPSSIFSSASCVLLTSASLSCFNAFRNLSYSSIKGCCLVEATLMMGVAFFEFCRQIVRSRGGKITEWMKKKFDIKFIFPMLVKIIPGNLVANFIYTLFAGFCEKTGVGVSRNESRTYSQKIYIDVPKLVLPDTYFHSPPKPFQQDNDVTSFISFRTCTYLIECA